MSETRPILIDAFDAAKLLSIPAHRVARLAKRGELPCVNLPSGDVRHSEPDLRDWVQEHRSPVSNRVEGKR